MGLSLVGQRVSKTVNMSGWMEACSVLNVRDNHLQMETKSTLKFVCIGASLAGQRG